MGRILFLDASFDRPFVAYDNTLVEVSKALSMAEIVETLGTFDAVAAGQGPGSYTGMRIALSLASALSLAWKVPLLTLSALYGLVPEGDMDFQAMLDARSGGVYLLEEGVPVKKSLDELVLKEVIISPRIAPLQARLPKNIRFIEAMPNPQRLFSLLEEKLNQGSYSLTGQAELLYLGRTL
ncbi:MAG: hypothetical protein WCN87_00430 [Chlamydiota bacterium]